jgi:adenine deaminase
MEQGFSVEGQVVDLLEDRIYPARIRVQGAFIGEITPLQHSNGLHLIPGFVDAHVHVESSMLPPSEFARMATVHGTVASVSDPHEIANVLGEQGVHFMLDNARGLPFVCCFGAPSCVPATAFETAGAELDAEAVARLLKEPMVGYLAEVMNFPGVLAADPGLMAKIRAAEALGKPVDGHAPGLRGEQAARYAAAGISAPITNASAWTKPWTSWPAACTS